jgi:hypothetical protein
MRKLLVTALAFAALLAGWATFAAVEIGKLRPPNEFLADFRAAMPEPREWRTFSKDDTKYLAAFGPARSPITFPSTEPVYVFDRTGRLVAWTLDEGDDPNFHRRWPAAFASEKVTRDVAAEWAAPAAAEPPG